MPTPDRSKSEGPGEMIRRVSVIVVALILAAQIIRSAVVSGLAATSPDVAVPVWGSHPAVEIAGAMTEIARVTRAGRPVPQSVLALTAEAAQRASLAPEPFLVRGVQAQLAGDDALAQRAFEAAQWRDPRSLPAAYFLADRYLRQGDVDRGLSETAALARLSPNGISLVGPYLATYASDRGNWPRLKRLMRENPLLADPVLNVLAAKPETVPAALALAPDRNAATTVWFARLLDTLIVAGDDARARQIWLQATGSDHGELIHDSSFKDKTGPPPFNWSLTSSAVGLAERQAGGHLHVIFYGQQDGILASQLLVLPAGSYRLSMQLLGDPTRARSLTWSLWCDKAASPIASVTLDKAASGWRFEVPANCPAQWLKLSGSSGDISQQIDVSIGGLSLQRQASHA
jgi:hypothetical protein